MCTRRIKGTGKGKNIKNPGDGSTNSASPLPTSPTSESIPDTHVADRLGSSEDGKRNRSLENTLQEELELSLLT